MGPYLTPQDFSLCLSLSFLLFPFSLLRESRIKFKYISKCKAEGETPRDTIDQLTNLPLSGFPLLTDFRKARKGGKKMSGFLVRINLTSSLNTISRYGVPDLVSSPFSCRYVSPNVFLFLFLFTCQKSSTYYKSPPIS